MSTRANIRLITFCMFLILAMVAVSATLIYSAGFQNLESYMTIEFQSGLVSLKFGNNAGSNINSSTCKVVYNDDKSKFKITGITPTISNGSVTNLSALTNSSGAEFYYFATNSAVLNTTGYADPGTTYHVSGLGTSENPACESWYDIPTNNTTLYATFMTPTHTSVPTTVGQLSGEVVFSHSIVSLPQQIYKVSEGWSAEETNTFSVAIIPNSITTLEKTSSSTSLKQSKRKSDYVFMVSSPSEDTDGTIFAYNDALTHVELPNSIITIPSNCFYFCSNLTYMNMPAGVTSIGSGAFFSCSGLKNVIIPEGLTNIESATFRGCHGLTSITIPDNVTNIENYAFYGCYGLTSITIPNGVTNIGNQVFSDCFYLTSITVLGSNTVYYSSGNCIIKKSDKSLIKGCNTSVIPNGVTSIETDAFEGCRQLSSITIPNSVTSIGSWCFYGCSNLTSITFADTSKTWSVKWGSTVKASDVSVANSTQNVTYFKSTYVVYDWTKNS